MRGDVLTRLMNGVRQDENGCWIWPKALCAEGYGTIRTDRHTGSARAHRVSYELMVGPIPDGLHLDHLCRVRSCINPDHLEPVTCRENVLRSPIALAAINARRVKCRRGHPFDDENTIRTRRGTRRCRICVEAYAATYRPPVKTCPECSKNYFNLPRHMKSMHAEVTS